MGAAMERRNLATCPRCNQQRSQRDFRDSHCGVCDAEIIAEKAAATGNQVGVLAKLVSFLRGGQGVPRERRDVVDRVLSGESQ